MFTFLLITCLIISLIFNISMFILIKILLKKINTYELWILEVKGNILSTLEKMRTIDKVGTFATSMNDKGTFESDDQVGQVFKELIELVEKLNQRIQ